jgi:hypothetical protein
MRMLTDHIVSGDQAVQLTIKVLDEPGAGGANHQYRVLWADDSPSSGDRAEPGCLIKFQNGPIKESGVNGLTHEALLAIVIDRLKAFQGGPFACDENEVALQNCEDALMWLQKRTLARLARGVEGTHQQ